MTMGASVETRSLSSVAREAAQRARFFEVPDHQRERLPLPFLVPPELRTDGIRVAGIRGEVKPADALDGDDLPRPQGAIGGLPAGPPPGGSPSASRHTSDGPHAAQELVCEWKRRSAGSAYSAAQAAHWVKGRIDVFSRSNGVRSTMEYRGPHCVQVMNG